MNSDPSLLCESLKSFARYKFREKTYGENEGFDQFVTELRLLVKDCNYPNSNEMIIDCIVFAINSERVLEKLLCHGSDLTLEKAIDIARSQLLQQQVKTMVSHVSNRASQSVSLYMQLAGGQLKWEQPHHGRKTTMGTDGDSAVRSRECGACAGPPWPNVRARGWEVL